MKEIPPPFTTRYYSKVLADPNLALPQAFTSRKKAGKLCFHDVARGGILRRRLALPNPIIYYNLCEKITGNWSTIESTIRRSRISKSHPKLGPSNGRAVIAEHTIGELETYKLLINGKSRYILRTDISKCYPSIYSHSIPWAAHGKAFAKIHRRYNHLGNAIDFWVRQGQDGQTMGIPIGPDTSFIIAEMILSAVDIEIEKKLGGLRWFRYSDDYYVGCTSYSVAEEALATIQEALSEYELRLNFLKTKIVELPSPIDSRWVSELRKYKFRRKAKKQHSDLIAFFDLSIEHAKDFKDESVLKYAIQRLNGVKIDRANWKITQNFLQQCVMNRNGLLPVVLSHLVRKSEKGYNVDLPALEYVLNFQIDRKSPLGYASDVAWAVWGLIYFSLNMSKDAADSVVNLKDSIVALLALDAENRGFVSSGLDHTKWLELMQTEELYGNNWLLAYEAKKQGWLPSFNVNDHIYADYPFRFLQENDVHFYDKQRATNVTPTGAPSSARTQVLFVDPFSPI